MPGLSIKLPLQRDADDGYALNKTYLEVVQQNFKHLLLTIPGERVMMPDFGVGLAAYLWQPNTQMVYADITNRISEQVAAYMSFINVDSVNFSVPEDELNSVYIRVRYTVKPLGIQDLVSVPVGINEF